MARIEFAAAIFEPAPPTRADIQARYGDPRGLWRAFVLFGMLLALATVGTSFNIYNTNATDPKTATLAAAAQGELIVVVASYTGQAAAPVITDDNSAGTYTEVTGGVAKAASADKLWIFVRNSLLPATQSTIVSAARAGTTGGGMVIFRLTGMTRFGTDAIRNWATTPQVGKQENQAAATPAPALPAAALTGNPTIGAVFNATNPATLTPPTSWLEKADLGYNTPTTGIEVVGRDSGFTGTTVTWGSASATAFCSVIVEFDASAAATVVVVDTPGALTFAGQVVGANVEIREPVTPGTVTFQGATVGAGVAVTAPVTTPGTLSFAGQVVGANVRVPVTPGALTFTGQTVGTTVAVVAPVTTPGTLTFAGQVVGANVRVPVTSGTLVFQGQAVGARVLVAAAVTPGTLVFQGQDVATRLLVALGVTPGALALQGQVVDTAVTGAAGPLIVTREGNEPGGAPQGAVLTVEREGDKAGGAPAGPIRVTTRQGS